MVERDGGTGWWNGMVERDGGTGWGGEGWGVLLEVVKFIHRIINNSSEIHLELLSPA